MILSLQSKKLVRGFIHELLAKSERWFPSRSNPSQTIVQTECECLCDEKMIEKFV